MKTRKSIVLFQFLILILPWANSLALAGQCAELGNKNGGEVLFGELAQYQTVYDAIVHYPQYRVATEYHMRSVSRVPKNGVILEAGGGTGNMTSIATSMRPDSKVYMSDFNPAMGEHAVLKGVPKENLSLGPDKGNILDLHLGGRKAKEGEIDLIYSHSVLWNLTKSEVYKFFANSARDLKQGGEISASTMMTQAEKWGAYFVKSIENGLKPAVKRGEIPADKAKTFEQQNAEVIKSLGKPDSPVKSTLSKQDIEFIAQKYGYEILDISGGYVVPTPFGPKAFFIQFKLRKK